jgi:hypothetical protein
MNNTKKILLYFRRKKHVGKNEEFGFGRRRTSDDGVWVDYWVGCSCFGYSLNYASRRNCVRIPKN